MYFTVECYSLVVRLITVTYIYSISFTNVLSDVPSVPDDQLAKVGVDTPDSRTGL